ncbi:uncharacterized protein J3R85_006928 [Psidium guajava]|nr:uncharacterized protein J3R85_006928 [Psidium guajava]
MEAAPLRGSVSGMPACENPLSKADRPRLLDLCNCQSKCRQVDWICSRVELGIHLWALEWFRQGTPLCLWLQAPSGVPLPTSSNSLDQ